MSANMTKPLNMNQLKGTSEISSNATKSKAQPKSCVPSPDLLVIVLGKFSKKDTPCNTKIHTSIVENLPRCYQTDSTFVHHLIKQIIRAQF